MSKRFDLPGAQPHAPIDGSHPKGWIEVEALMGELGPITTESWFKWPRAGAERSLGGARTLRPIPHTSTQNRNLRLAGAPGDIVDAAACIDGIRSTFVELDRHVSNPAEKRPVANQPATYYRCCVPTLMGDLQQSRHPLAYSQLFPGLSAVVPIALSRGRNGCSARRTKERRLPLRLGSRLRLG